jgi:hypothetical protein
VNWPTPEGLSGQLEIDQDAATTALKEMPFEFGLPLRDYQKDLNLNQKLRGGAQCLDRVEVVARQLKSFFESITDIPRITRHMRLPQRSSMPAFDPYSKVDHPSRRYLFAPLTAGGPPASIRTGQMAAARLPCRVTV